MLCIPSLCLKHQSPGRHLSRRHRRTPVMWKIVVFHWNVLNNRGDVCDVTLSVYPHRTSLPNACPLWIYTIDILYTLDSASLLVKLKPRIFQRLPPFE
jgi:hypothetical protein